MSVDANGTLPTRRVLRSPQTANLRLGVSTQRFFQEGEEQEANGFKNVALVDDVVDPRALEFDSFDKVPRKRRPLIAIAAISSAVALGVTSWVVFGGLWKQDPAQSIAAPSVAAALPVSTEKPVVQPIAVAPAEPAEIQEPQKVALLEPEGVGRLEAVARQEPALPVVVEPATLKVSPLVQPARMPGNPTQKTRVGAKGERISKPSSGASRPEPVRGYVWSPTARALVPIEGAASVETALTGSAPAVSAPPVSPTAEPAAEPSVGSAGLKIAPADTGPAPSETSRVPIEPAPLLE